MIGPKRLENTMRGKDLQPSEGQFTRYEYVLDI